ncbi:MAG: FkbM family methyltransferase [Leptospirales bacterium]|jgi:FkbM family methyltransferase
MFHTNLKTRRRLIAGIFLIALPLTCIGIFQTRAGLNARYAIIRVFHRNFTATPVHGFRMFLNPDDRIITPYIMSYRSWEAEQTGQIVEHLRPGDTFVDAGANVGYYTLVAANLVGKTGRVFAFEPDPESYAILLKNIKLNGLTNVIAEQMALSNAPGALKLYLAKENKGDHHTIDRGDELPFVEVPAVTLDEYFRDDARGVDFIKIDTQGAEASILSGMQTLLDRNAAMKIVMEFGPDSIRGFGFDPRVLLNSLRKRGYILYDINEDPPLTQPTNVDELLRKYPATKPETNLLLLSSER